MPARLGRLKLDKSRPGFYDDPVFLAAERGDPTLLEGYAGFVEARQNDEHYLAYARARVRETASFLQSELRADGRRGACVDLSHAVSRFLERQGVWNYIVTGAVTLNFPRSSGVPTKHFWPIGCGPSIPGAAAAHAWVRVPPFVVADLTLAMQEYSEGEERLLPDTVLAEDASPGAVALSDLLDPEARAELARHVHGQPEVGDVRLVDAGLLDRIRKFGVWDLQHKGTRIRYVACAVSAPDGPMESAKNLQLSGKYMIKLWHQFEKVARPPTGPT